MRPSAIPVPLNLFRIAYSNASPYVIQARANVRRRTNRTGGSCRPGDAVFAPRTCADSGRPVRLLFFTFRW
jgi:hypothetical protein